MSIQTHAARSGSRASRSGAPRGGVALLCALGLLAQTPARADTAGSLYQRLGGEDAVTGIATDLIERAARDPATRRSFEGVRLAHTERQLALQLCEVTGGGCARNDDSMRDVHAGLGITQQEFYALVEILREVMVRRGIALRERNELLALLAPMKRDVVEK